AQIPTRLGFADVKNHLSTEQLTQYMGSDLFVYHGYVEFFLNGKWVKATPAFNKALCQHHDVPPLEFDGTEDSIFHAYNNQKKRFMEYVTYHGTFADIPFDAIQTAWRQTYGNERVDKWIKMFETGFLGREKDFYQEDVIR
ncbi:MAG: hypothetical protein PVI90_16685, partial [Desulfobacteraceae bacterium]